MATVLSGKLCTSVSSPGPQFLSGKLATEWALRSQELLQAISTGPGWGAGGAAAWAPLMASRLCRPQTSKSLLWHLWCLSRSCPTPGACRVVPHSFPVTSHHLSSALSFVRDCQRCPQNGCLAQPSGAPEGAYRNRPEPARTGRNQPELARTGCRQCRAAASLSHSAPAATLVPMAWQGHPI